MDLKFTFTSPNDHSEQPASPLGKLPIQPVSSASSELFVELSETGDGIKARAVSGDGVPYGEALRKLREGEALGVAARSALARVVAEVGEPLSSAISGVRLSPALHDALLELDAFDPSGSFTSESLQRRAGVSLNTPVEVTAA